jgi:hypothetical protein
MPASGGETMNEQLLLLCIAGWTGGAGLIWGLAYAVDTFSQRKNIAK